MNNTKVKNETSEPVPVNVVAGGSGDGSILDGVSTTIKATVKDLVNSNPLTVAVVDAAGDQITSFTGGTVQQGNPPWSQNLTQVNGVAVSVGNGISGTGVLRVTVASDSTGVLSVSQSGNWNQGILPRTSGGLTTFHLVSAATTNATNIKASAGQVFGWYIYNNNAAARKVAFHNTAGAPTAGTSIFFSLVLPPNAGANVFSDIGIPFSTGIAITTVTGVADNDSTAVALNDLIINIWYS